MAAFAQMKVRDIFTQQMVPSCQRNKGYNEWASVPSASKMPSTKFKANPMSMESKNPKGINPIGTTIEFATLEGPN